MLSKKKSVTIESNTIKQSYTKDTDTQFCRTRVIHARSVFWGSPSAWSLFHRFLFLLKENQHSATSIIRGTWGPLWNPLIWFMSHKNDGVNYTPVWEWEFNRLTDFSLELSVFLVSSFLSSFPSSSSSVTLSVETEGQDKLKQWYTFYISGCLLVGVFLPLSCLALFTGSSSFSSGACSLKHSEQMSCMNKSLHLSHIYKQCVCDQ